ncbi:MAG: hypothetical protein HYV29_06435 [Ignavibacteriales bacterium]|nr:hypothetical protein [Ignavibacteriales bacterium]
MLPQASTNIKSVTVLCCAFLFFGSCASVKDFGKLERNQFFQFEPEVRALINSPAAIDSSKPTHLILYALPNGNSIEMSAGRQMKPDLDWHYDIQHIAAQTRFLRSELTDRNIIIAYLECEGKSWPAWRQKHENSSAAIARIVEYVRFETNYPKLVMLSGHSGGGSFLTGYLNAFDSIPEHIYRIAYLDANYSFEDSLHHGQKLFDWLNASTSRTLAVIAYDDREIIYNGKKIIGPTGGTFRATQRMMQSFAARTNVSSHQDSTIIQYSAIGNRARFIVHTNPDTLILHTVLVERNGFIHSVLMNTKYEEKNYKFFGNRVYNNLISEQ